MENSRRDTLIINSELSSAEIRDVQRRVAKGELKRLYRGMATNLPEDQWPQLVRRNWSRIAGSLFPQAVVGFRSAMDGATTEPLLLTYTHPRTVELPGLRIIAYSGPPPAPGDSPLADSALHWPSRARTFLDNLTRNEGGRNVPIELLEDKLAEICEISGEERLLKLREEAESIAPYLHREREFQVLSQKIGAILGTREAQGLQSPSARLIAQAVDPERLELFDALISALRRRSMPVTPDPAKSGTALENFAFLEAYFSNFIEGTEFEIEEAADIALRGRIVERRPKDSHDVLGVFHQIVNPAWRYQTLLTTEAVIEQLAGRHKDMMQARPEIAPGEYKTQTNVAGNTRFVAPRLVRGTLIAGAKRLPELEPGLARALYAMFLISEIHPFSDGNGRLARLVMNAELSAASQCRIIVPTLYRETYLDNLRALTREKASEGYFKAMFDIQGWTSKFDYSNVDELIAAVRRTNALERSLADFRLLPHTALFEASDDEMVEAHRPHRK